MSERRRNFVTLGIVLSFFLASMESTVVTTAMPTIIGQFGGLEQYAWVFSAFMLSSTTTVPLYGKLSDIYGRRNIYLIAIALFLLGSLLCGRAQNMEELIFARVLQGLGAGGIAPLAFILIGEMFTLKQRANLQGLFSGIWGFSSVAGPLLGGFIVDHFSWPWIFYLNIAPGLLAAGLVAFAWQDPPRTSSRPAVDYAGAFLLTTGIVALLIGLMDPGTIKSWGLLLFSIIILVILLLVEKRAADPILPISLLRQDKLFASSITHGLLSGWALFGTVSYLPLFVQTVLGGGATEAGLTITPILMGWVLASIVGTRLIMRSGYYKLALLGTFILVAGAGLLASLQAETSQALLILSVGLMGIGMGLSVPSFLIAVQTNVERPFLGTATSTLQFSRSIGGTLGVSIMGAALSARLSANLNSSGLDPRLVSTLLDPLPGAGSLIDPGLRLAVGDAISVVFIFALGAAVLALATVIFLTPRISLAEKQEPSIPVLPE